MPPSRNDNETTTPCPVCATGFTPIRRQRYCSPACRQAAWRTRHTDPTPQPAVVIPPRTPRRANSVYQCPECDQRLLGQQWCNDCNHPCIRIDFGAPCPHCGEPVTINDIADQYRALPVASCQ